MLANVKKIMVKNYVAFQISRFVKSSSTFQIPFESDFTHARTSFTVRSGPTRCTGTVVHVEHLDTSSIILTGVTYTLVHFYNLQVQ